MIDHAYKMEVEGQGRPLEFDQVHDCLGFENSELRRFTKDLDQVVLRISSNFVVIVLLDVGTNTREEVD